MENNLHPRTAYETISNKKGLMELQFIRTTSELLKEAINGDLTDVASMKQELSLIEDSNLRAHQVGDNWFFGAYPIGSKKETGISQDSRRIHALARRWYLEQRIKIIEKNVSSLQKVMDTVDSAAYEARVCAKLNRWEKAGLDVYQIIFSKEQNEWINQAYSPNPYYQSNLKYKTNQGVPVRSKSESLFGSFIESFGVPFRSDDLVRIHSDAYGNRPFRESYFADFKIPNLCGGITIHEHLGAFHLDDYAENALKRLNDYNSFSLYELSDRQVKPEEITWSFESDLHDSIRMRRLIRKILLPGTC